LFYVGVQKYSWKTKTGETDLGKDETIPTLQTGRLGETKRRVLKG
jgi:hypothetical protein